jgi:hypothetical protein
MQDRMKAPVRPVLLFPLPAPAFYSQLFAEQRTMTSGQKLENQRGADDAILGMLFHGCANAASRKGGQADRWIKGEFNLRIA